MSPIQLGHRILVGLLLLLALLFLFACGEDGGEGEATASLPQGAEPVDLDPAEFTVEIDNPYWPMRPGSRWVYRERDGEGGTQRVVVTVAREAKRIANGIEVRVVHDVVSQDGEPVEITDDWYAQDSVGNVWYLGERTAEYENGEVVSRAGSWEAGVDGAQPVSSCPPNHARGSPTARSTTSARRRTGRRCSASTSRSRSPSATSPMSC